MLQPPPRSETAGFTPTYHYLCDVLEVEIFTFHFLSVPVSATGTSDHTVVLMQK